MLTFGHEGPEIGSEGTILENFGQVFGESILINAIKVNFWSSKIFWDTPCNSPKIAFNGFIFPFKH